MALGKKVSPAKFLGAVALGMGVLQGATQIIGGISERKRLRGEMRRTRKQFRKNRETLQGMQFENPYADLQTSFENPYEDLTVNQQQAQFEAEQAAQSRANVLDSLRGAAGPSGIAGLAQSLANQATVDRARASASIGQQESRNQVLAARGAESVSQREQAAEQTVMRGEAQRQAQERQRTMNIMQLEAGKNEALTGLRQQRAEAVGDIVGGIGTIGGAAFDAFGAGMFSKPKTTGIGNTGIGSVDLNSDSIPDYLTQGTNLDFIGPRNR
tara:strand:+ start:29 stop:838 length:810 start_codon:yes stop_codon:yes gene_type:complete